MKDFRLYFILDTQLTGTKDILTIAAMAVLGGVDLIQLRAKDWPDRQVIAMGRKIKEITRRGNIRLIINDRADLAKIIAAEGVHLGQEDLPIKDARGILGKDKIIGISTHSIAQVQEAEKQDPDYIAVGPIFATETKPGLPPLTERILSQLDERLRASIVAVGGINPGNLQQVLSTGVRRIAVSRAILESADVADSAKKLRQRLDCDDTVRTS